MNISDKQHIKGYELQERIGTGGFGAVYKAYQSTVGREVAIKVILPGLANQPDFIRRFESEAQVVARLEHPYIIPLYDYWRDPEGAYLVMRWLRGGSLADALRNGAFELRATALLLDQVAGALSLAHRNGVIHRDIKPANILLDEDGNAYLTDFGIAKDLNLPTNNTHQDAIVGSLDYISPEQARSEPVTPRTDIYSLGVTLFEVITGHHPFENMSSVERLYKHINEPLPEITTLEPGVQEAVNHVIQKATAKNPEHRYPDALALAADFRESLGMNRSSTTVEELLTQREHEILNLIIDGLANKEIAQRLTLTLGTVKWHVNQIYSKLGVRSRVQAIVRAREMNLIAKPGEPLYATPVPTEEFFPQNPYKGLLAFQAADHQDFFGREKVTARLVRRLSEEGEKGRFLAVVGPSGSGKSSLVRAGLIPALWRGDIPGSEKWFVVEMLPGAHPLDELEVALTRVASNQALNLNEHLRRDSRGLVRAAGLILPNDGSELVLIIDQFEEAFTLLEAETERAHFLDLIHTAATQARSRVRVVITLRADFYDRPLHYPDFGDLVRTYLETIMPLSATELEQAITRPAERVAVAFEPGLVAAIIGDVNYQPGALPLLQYALTELFERRRGHLLTHEAYQAIGGTVGALATRAEEVFNSLSEVEQEVARQMFLRLATLGEGTEDTRRRTDRAELQAVAEDDETIDEIIDAFAAYRLFSLDTDPGTRRPTVEVAHEALLREWERLRAWLNDSRDEIRIQRQLATMAEEWRDAEKDVSFLASGSRLDQFERWEQTTRIILTVRERDYLRASIAVRDQQIRADLERQAREQHLEKRSQTVLRVLVVVFALATFVTLLLAIAAIGERNRADEALASEKDIRVDLEDSLLALQELALVNGAQSAYVTGDLDTARILSLVANMSDNPSNQSRRILMDAAYAPGTRRLYRDARYNYDWNFATLSPGRTVMLTMSYTNSEVVIWDLISGEVTGVFPAVHEDAISVIAFRPTTADQVWQLLTASDDANLILWDYASQQAIRTYTQHTASVWAAAFSPDGMYIASGSEDGTVLLWGTDSGEVVYRLQGHTDAIWAFSFNSDGTKLLSSSGDGTVILWDTTTGQLIDQFNTGLLPVNIAFSPDSARFLVSYITPFSMGLWDIETRREIRTFRRQGPMFSPRFSADGQAVGGPEGNRITFFNVNTGEVSLSFSGHTHAVTAIFPNEGFDQMISVSRDGTIREWDMRDGSELIRTLPLFPFHVMDGEFSPDAQTFVLAAGGNDPRPDLPGLVLLYDAHNGKEIQRLGIDGFAHTGSTNSVRFSPDGQQLVSADRTGEIKLWDVSTGALIWQVEGLTMPVNSLDFTPDGSAFIASSDEGVVLWIDTTTGEIIHRFDLGSPVKKAILTHDATRFLACLVDVSSGIILADAQTGEVLLSISASAPFCRTLVVASDGQTFASGHLDGNILLWDLTTGHLIRRFSGGMGNINELIFSDDGQTLYVASHPGASQSSTVTAWDVSNGEMYRSYGVVPAPFDALSLSKDGRKLLAGAFSGVAWIWRVDDRPSLIDWVHANRYIPELTCEQRELYRIEPLCA